MKDFKGQSAPLDATTGLGSGDPNTNTEAPDIKWASEGLLQGTHIHITPDPEYHFIILMHLIHWFNK